MLYGISMSTTVLPPILRGQSFFPRTSTQKVFKIAVIVNESTWLLLSPEDLEKAWTESRLRPTAGTRIDNTKRTADEMILDDARATAIIRANLGEKFSHGPTELEFLSIKGGAHTHQVLIARRSGPKSGENFYRPAMYAEFCIRSGIWQKVSGDKLTAG